ncbi:MAG: hypothetical protein EP343_04120 [Deltaproteobacteria bacterium]|nr:MAG: hypothetical protein EP343_04120 [Deltaproteobacteria bacterium]
MPIDIPVPDIPVPDALGGGGGDGCAGCFGFGCTPQMLKFLFYAGLIFGGFSLLVQQLNIYLEKRHKQARLQNIVTYLKAEKNRMLPFSYVHKHGYLILMEMQKGYRGFVRLSKGSLEILLHKESQKILTGSKTLPMLNLKKLNLWSRMKRLVSAEGKTFILIHDIGNNGLDDNDKIGLYKFKNETFTVSKLRDWKSASLSLRIRLKEQYEKALDMADQAIEFEKKHVQRIEQLRKGKKFSFPYTIKASIRKNEKKQQQGQVFVEKGALAVVYRKLTKPYNCKRRLLKLLKKVCEGTQIEQHLFLDRNKPGLHVSDNDRVGVRIIRGNQTIETEFKPFQSYPLLERDWINQRYREFVWIASHHANKR